jgi:hypothetical protein
VPLNAYPTTKPAVKTAIALLQTAIAGDQLGVGYKMPLTWPAVYIKVSRAGGGPHPPTDLVTDAARIMCEVYGANAADVEAATSDAIAALRNSFGTTINGVFLRGFDNIDGPTAFDDVTVPDMCRWQFQGDLLVSTN